MKIDQKTLAEMLDEILPPPIADGDLNTRILAERRGITERMARGALDKLVKEGKAERYNAFDEVTRRVCTAYRVK